MGMRRPAARRRGAAAPDRSAAPGAVWPARRPCPTTGDRHGSARPAHPAGRPRAARHNTETLARPGTEHGRPARQGPPDNSTPAARRGPHGTERRYVRSRPRGRAAERSAPRRTDTPRARVAPLRHARNRGPHDRVDCVPSTGPSRRARDTPWPPASGLGYHVDDERSVHARHDAEISACDGPVPRPASGRWRFRPVNHHRAETRLAAKRREGLRVR